MRNSVIIQVRKTVSEPKARDEITEVRKYLSACVANNLEKVHFSVRSAINFMNTYDTSSKLHFAT